ncbi:hypothetical protein PQ478_09270 [Alkalihalophilus pseudofirmus]|uniref:hypothetical protein n=1 Tax=Alkalihalophilus pseudofirmus TaxID=79885 RepID=UPI00259B22C7|nr:hypothetical protein [Alkalihalophilus pseudofirmus]WEG18659.1 hypothetical protein PQ478_09270 [Alkalihalophilus pseudofirmus]
MRPEIEEGSMAWIILNYTPNLSDLDWYEYQETKTKDELRDLYNTAVKLYRAEQKEILK